MVGGVAMKRFYIDKWKTLYTRWVLPIIGVHNTPDAFEITIGFWKWNVGLVWEKK